jgi:hypothetical protein
MRDLILLFVQMQQTTPRPKSVGKKAKAGSRKETKIAAPNSQVRRTERKAGKIGKNAADKKAAKPADNREGSKKDFILELLRRKEGATIAEIAKMTNWQNHTVRGFISGTVAKKMGLAVESAKNDAGGHHRDTKTQELFCAPLCLCVL